MPSGFQQQQIASRIRIRKRLGDMEGDNSVRARLQGPITGRRAAPIHGTSILGDEGPPRENFKLLSSNLKCVPLKRIFARRNHLIRALPADSLVAGSENGS